MGLHAVLPYPNSKPKTMKTPRWIVLAALAGGLSSQMLTPTLADLIKIDFGQSENERVPVDPNTNEPLTDPNGIPLVPPNLLDWNVIPTWTFLDPNANVTDGSASLKGVASADATSVTWSLLDSTAPSPNTKVTLTILDNLKLAGDALMLGQTANNPTKEGIDVFYDGGVRVPYLVKDDYLYRNPDNAGTESLMRIANLTPGTYNVTVFEGRTTDGNGRFGKVWVDDISGSKEPGAENTGNYSGVAEDGTKLYKGQPQTQTVTIKAGEYLWFAEMEDNSGGISGMIVRSVDPTDSTGLFKVDFGQSENEREPVVDGSPQNDPDGKPVGPPPLIDWNVIPTWTFADPNANVTDGSASIKGTPNPQGTEVTWKLTDFSKDGNKNVTLTILDNAKLAGDAPMLGGTANNPTKEGIAMIYDGVLVPAAVKDDYIYRNPDTAGSESLMRVAGLKAGKYNVTLFEGRTSDGNGRFGKVWVDDISGAKEPGAENTGNYSGNDSGTAVPFGQPRTVTVDVKDGQYIWVAEMEDNSGGISGMIIRGVSTGGGGGGGTAPAISGIKQGSDGKVTITWTGGGQLETSGSLTGPWAPVAGATTGSFIWTPGANDKVVYARVRN